MKDTGTNNSFQQDDYEDLTLFADESFDTGDVDLFEFSSEEDSPLTRLKSTILSLDWEITDEILQELEEEITYLKESWGQDQVADVYLQGLGKIGHYIRKRGAFSHPNAIKLLLTFYYDFEKITSSETITADEIQLLLKADVRKFKILQYQIKNSEENALNEKKLEYDSIHGETKEISAKDQEEHPLKMLKASILGLDWEVTEENLQQFDYFLVKLKEDSGTNKIAATLIQGLNALGDYIKDTGASSHPEAFNLLHSFTDAFEMSASPSNDPEHKKKVKSQVQDCVLRLNGLKHLIAGKPGSPEMNTQINQLVDQVTSEQPQQPAKSPASVEQTLSASPVKNQPAFEEPAKQEIASVKPEEENFSLESELDALFPTSAAPAVSSATPAMESSSEKYPDEVLPPEAIHPVDDEVADDFIESEVSSKRGLTPALSGMEEMSEFNEASHVDDETEIDLNAQLDRLFASDDDSFLANSGTSDPLSALSDVTDDETDLPSALSNIEADDETDALPQPPDDDDILSISSKLDSFFTDSDNEADTASQDVSEPEEGIAPALAGSDEEIGFSLDESLEGADSKPLADIEEKLNFFFDDDDIVDMEESEEEQPAAALSDEIIEEPEVALTPEAEPASVLTQATDDDFNIYLTTLGALLPSAIRTPTDKGITEASGLISELKQCQLPAGQKVLVQLLGSTIDQLVHSAHIDCAKTEQLVNALFEAIHTGQTATENLPAIIEQFTAWQSDLLANITAQKASPILPMATGKAVATEEREHIDLQQLRAIIREEFDQLKNELKK